MKAPLRFLQSYFSPISYNILKESTKLIILERGLGLLFLIVVSCNIWIVAKDIPTVWGISLQGWVKAMYHPSVAPQLLATFLWGVSRILNQQGRLKQLPSTTLFLLMLSPILLVTAAIKFKDQLIMTDSRFEYQAIEEILGSYLKTGSHFHTLDAFLQVAYILIGILNIATLLLQTRFEIMKLIALLKIPFQTGRALYHRYKSIFSQTFN